MNPAHLDPNLYQDLEARGLLKQVTDPGLAKSLASAPMTLYCGFDPTSDCLHVGNLLPILTLRRFQLAGHRPIALVGGATGMIGDPSGKSQERNLLDDAQLQKNLAGIKKIISKFLAFDGPNAALLVNNGDWFKGISFIDFLGDVGKHFTANHMMAKESVRARLEDRDHGISYTEFSYMLLQAYDFYVLNEREKCSLQVGGSDQWGNITAGTELIRRMRAAQSATSGKEVSGREVYGQEVYGMTHPLVSKSDGTKFGKTEQGAVWLEASRTSPYRFYQFFIQTTDADVVSYLHFFTFLSITEIARLAECVKTAPEKREAQQTLTRELTLLVHGKAELERAEKATQALFGDSIRELDERTLLDVLAGAPQTSRPRSAVEGAGLSLIDALVETTLCQSKGAAKKEIAAGGIYLNNTRISDIAAMIKKEDLIVGAHVVLRKGKKTYHLLSFAT